MRNQRTRWRHPVSVARRRLGTAFLILIALGLGWYTFRTRDTAIRKRAIAFLENITSPGVEISVKAAAFQMFEGITLQDVRVSVPYDTRLDPQALDPDSRTILSARSLKLYHNPWRLLLGQLKIDRIVAVQPTIIIAQNPTTGLRNWQLLFGQANQQTIIAPAARPIVILRSAKAIAVSIDENGRHSSAPEKLDIDIRPRKETKTGFTIEVRRYTEPIEHTTVLFDPGERMVANTPYLDARTVRLQLPKPLQELFESLSLTGEVKLSRLIYDSTAPKVRDTEIELRRVRCEIPDWLLTSSAPAIAEHNALSDRSLADDASLKMTNVRGMLHLHMDQLHVDITGRMNGASCHLNGTLDHLYGDLNSVGLDLSFNASRLRIPEAALRKRLLADTTAPTTLQKILRDYDPHGEIDIDLTFQRSADAPGSLQTTGTLRPLAASGSCRWFPYPLTDLAGQVRFDGKLVHIENLHGSHGDASVNIRGTVDRNSHPAVVDLDITGSRVALDAPLYEALSQQYQAIWRRFKPQGFVNISTRLHRPTPGATHAKAHWEKQIDIELLGSRITPFPVAESNGTRSELPLDNLYGRVSFDDGHIKLIGLEGRAHGATVKISGNATIEPSSRSDLDIHVQADGLKLDDAFVEVLPPNIRKTFSQFHPRGTADLSAVLTQHDATPGLDWELHANLQDAALLYQPFPYQLEAVEAELTINPQGLSITNATAHHGRVVIAAAGDIQFSDRGHTADLAFEARELILDSELFEALPSSLKKVWRQINPQGRVQLRTGLHLVSQDGQQVIRHRTEIEPLNAQLRFLGFPLPLSSVTGKVLVTHDHIEILSLRGNANGMELQISGQIDLTKPGQHGSLVIHATNLTLSDPLFDAMPKSMRRIVASMNPTGRFDLTLDPLQYEIDSAGRFRWIFDGKLQLSGAHADLGFQFDRCKGILSGHGSIDEAGRLTMSAQADLQEAFLAGWHLRHVKALFIADAASQRIRIENATAELYGGHAEGFAEIDTSGTVPRYQASFTMRDVQLDEYLAERRANRGSGNRNSTDDLMGRGSVSGNLVVRGLLDRSGEREGVGEITVSQARVWKLPFVFAIFQVLNLTPDKNVFHDGQLKFFLSADRLTFQKIDLQGSAMSFIGGGYYDLKNKQLDITLLAGRMLRIRVPLLTDILETASREIIQLHIQGTLEKPSFRLQPLKSLATALKSLFPELPKANRKKPISLPGK